MPQLPLSSALHASQMSALGALMSVHSEQVVMLLEQRDGQAQAAGIATLPRRQSAAISAAISAISTQVTAPPWDLPSDRTRRTTAL